MGVGQYLHLARRRHEIHLGDWQADAFAEQRVREEGFARFGPGQKPLGWVQPYASDGPVERRRRRWNDRDSRYYNGRDRGGYAEAQENVGQRPVAAFI